MFHIKTDIRQYKCESEEKVERLIRNWVIRPSDLIYNADEKTWKPIGQHTAFDDIFAVIEQEESNEPDTIVTEAPSEVAAEHEVEPGSELESHEDAQDDEEAADEESLDEASDEAAVAQPTGDDATDEPPTVLEADRADLHADSEEITNVTEAPEKDDDAAEAGDADLEDEESTDVREDPRTGEDEESTDVREDPRTGEDEENTDVREDPRNEEAEGQPDRPEAPEGVAGVIRDSDEITMMTDRTFEMLREERGVDDQKSSADDEPEAQGEAAEDDQAVESADEAISDEEPTQVVERESIDQDSDASSEDAPSSEDAEPDDAQPADGADKAEEESDAAARSDEEDPPEADEAPSGAGKGRHGLPEEIFVTDEIPQSGVQQAVLDELGDVEHDGPRGPTSEDTDITDGRDGGRQPRWRIVMSDEDKEKASESDKPSAVATADTDETDPAESSDAEVSDDDDLDGMLDQAAELVGLGEESNPVTINAAEIEPVDDESADDEPRERAETPVRKVAQKTTFVSEGYKLPLPIDVSPSPEDIRLGLKHSRVPKPKKDATFPHPRPKTAGEVTMRRFDLDPEEPRDHSFVIVAALVFGFVLVLLAAITLLG